MELSVNGPLTDQVMTGLGDHFTLGELEQSTRNVFMKRRFSTAS